MTKQLEVSWKSGFYNPNVEITAANNSAVSDFPKSGTITINVVNS